jgi:3-oxoacyl-ACP reductase-like protein
MLLANAVNAMLECHAAAPAAPAAAAAAFPTRHDRKHWESFAAVARQVAEKRWLSIQQI